MERKSGYNYERVPILMLKGDYLEKFGFITFDIQVVKYNKRVKK